MRVVCALSGGGAKSAAHVGAYKALVERGLIPAHYVGTSIGGVIGARLASGLTYEQTLLRVSRIRRRDVVAISPAAMLGYYSESFLREGPLRETIARIVPARRFADLEVPLTVTAVDLQNGQLVLFGAGGRERVPLIDALYASAALPVYYPPAEIGDRRYVDGGLRAVLPIDVAAMFDPDLIVAVDVGPSLYEEPARRPAPVPPLVRMHGSVLRVMMAAQTEDAVERWKANGSAPGRPQVVVVRPIMEAEATFSVDRVTQFIEAGYRATVRALAHNGVAG